MSSTGTTTSSSQFFVLGGCTVVTGRPPARKRSTSLTGLTVADNPMRCAGESSNASSRSSVTARCAPRFVPATAWISSTMTYSTPRRRSRALLVRRRNRDSGVVMRTSAERDENARRSVGVVSPERTATPRSGSSRPRRVLACLMPTSGERRLRSTSTARAFIGET